ncbi:MAG: PD40 domain-containing protein [Phycisphaerales bacterium]|nr:MAG: PD40 domain-containing protein [Phycisphaerales bacterium]
MHCSDVAMGCRVSAGRVLLLAFFAVSASCGAAGTLNLSEVSHEWVEAAPLEEIEKDWMMQDHGLDTSACFHSPESAALESAMLEKVLLELDRAEPRLVQSFREALARLQAQAVPGSDPAWRRLYLRACRRRRALRLQHLVATYPRIIYTKHYNLGGSHYAYTENPTDSQFPERERGNSDWRMGAALCLLEVSADGSVRSRILLEEPDGLIRDPDVSYDGQRILFSRRDTAYKDDLHVYELDLSAGDVRQLTFGPGFADDEPVYLPDGNILFNSTRCTQIVDCWWTDVTNLYVCDGDGRFLRRLTFDQVHTNYPKVLADGRVIYTRWDYNDRGQIYPQPLFVMNSDGTAQTEFYGNNSWFPTTIMHARGIPGSRKVIAVASGHHSHQRGKLILIDTERGRQEATGVQLICPVRETRSDRIDAYGQQGDQFQYPYPIDEEHFLVTYDPVGSPVRAYRRPYGIYFMDIDGHRELLAWDKTISCNQPVPFVRRPVPHAQPSAVDYTQDEGVYYLQDIYRGPGLVGIPRGTIKRLRVVALEFRAAGFGRNTSGGVAGGALSSTPVSVGNGCWDVKVVLGQARVQEDGSACFKIPARTPVYFQALDEQNRVVQTMRSWSTLQPGERFSCVGCHEPKRQTPGPSGLTLAMKSKPQDLEPFYGPARGFSFAREIQPILDRRCVSCHDDRDQVLDWSTPSVANKAHPVEGHAFSLLATPNHDLTAMRYWSDSYLALTRAAPLERHKGNLQGHPNRLVSWITAQSEPSMLPPMSAGSTKSGLFDLLAQGHAGLELTREELDKIACWIDLGVPFCGDYREACAWPPSAQAEYAYYQHKRNRMAAIEWQNIEALLRFQRDGTTPVHWTTFDAGGPAAKSRFIEDYLRDHPQGK